MDQQSFLNLPTESLARIVREAGPKVMVFPINGTRRWLMLEHPAGSGNDVASAYDDLFDLMAVRSTEIFRLCFEHGVDTLLTPAYGPDLLERGDAHMQMVAAGLARMTTHPIYTDFYAACQVRVRFYGDYRKYFKETPYQYLLDAFDDLTRRTASHNRHRLLIGLFAHDATETIGELAIRHYNEHHTMPDRRALVQLYYGEYIDPVSLFIGFERFSAFDMPLLALGGEDLYFTVTPSFYFSQKQLREILYDHLFTRRIDEPDYSALTSDEWDGLRGFYRINRDKTLGIGRAWNKVWCPLTQVEIPPDF